MLQAKIAQVSPGIRSVSYRLSFNGRIEAVKEGNKLRINSFYKKSKQRSVWVKVEDFPWMVCNPFVLHKEIKTHTTAKGLEKMFERIDKEFARSKTTLESLRGFIFSRDYADETYYTLALLATKLRSGSLSGSLAPEAFLALKDAVSDAFREGDVPMLGFLNGYLVNFPKNFRKFPRLSEIYQGIEELCPGMTTQNVCSTTKHILKM